MKKHKPLRYGSVEDVDVATVEELKAESALNHNRYRDVMVQNFTLREEISSIRKLLIPIIEKEEMLRPDHAREVFAEMEFNPDDPKNAVHCAEILRRLLYYQSPQSDEMEKAIKKEKDSVIRIQSELNMERERVKELMVINEQLKKKSDRVVTAKSTGMKIIVKERPSSSVMMPSPQNDSPILVTGIQGLRVEDEVLENQHVAKGDAREIPDVPARLTPLKPESLLVRSTDAHAVSAEPIYEEATQHEDGDSFDYEETHSTDPFDSPDYQEDPFEAIEPPEEDDFTQEPEQELPTLQEVSEPTYLTLLKDTEVKIMDTENPRFDRTVIHQGKKAHLRYIDFPIDNVNFFDSLMDGVDDVCFLFSDSDLFRKGQSQFTKWIIRSPRRKDIEFSFTSIDKLEVSGGLESFNHL